MIGTILKTVTGPIAEVVGSWQAKKAKAKEVEGEIAKAKMDYKKAKWETRIELLQTQSQRDMSYDMQVLKNRQHTWLDEFIGVSIVGITLAAFLPWTAPYVKEGWEAVASAPFWFQFAWITLIASTLGGLTILRILMGSKIGNSIKQKVQGDFDPKQTTTSKSQSDASQTQKNPPLDQESREQPEQKEDEEDSPYPFEERKGP